LGAHAGIVVWRRVAGAGAPHAQSSLQQCSPSNGPSPNGDERSLSDASTGAWTDTRANRANLDRLTARQLQVVALLADGLRYRDVAACLSITEGQVQRHVARAVERLDVHTANELVAVAVAEGLVPDADASDSP
jgi:DNA-binding CsgD family transcriptional regulator